MWWCCGKNKKTSPGCKFQKHFSKDDEQESEEEETKGIQKARCVICKENGHKANECDKDPNIRTLYDVADEQKRIMKNAATKKKLADAWQVTYQMLEKMTLVSNERMTTQILTQDDFNYQQFNQNIFNLNILIEGLQSDSSSDEELMEELDEDGEIILKPEGETTPIEETLPKRSKFRTTSQQVKLFTETQKNMFKRAQQEDPFDELVRNRSASTQPGGLVLLQNEVSKLVEIQRLKDMPQGNKKKRTKRKKITSTNESQNSIESGNSAFTLHSNATGQQNRRHQSFRGDLPPDIATIPETQKLLRPPKKHQSENKGESFLQYNQYELPEQYNKQHN